MSTQNKLQIKNIITIIQILQETRLMRSGNYIDNYKRYNMNLDQTEVYIIKLNCGVQSLTMFVATLNNKSINDLIETSFLNSQL